MKVQVNGGYMLKTNTITTRWNTRVQALHILKLQKKLPDI